MKDQKKTILKNSIEFFVLFYLFFYSILIDEMYGLFSFRSFAHSPSHLIIIIVIFKWRIKMLRDQDVYVSVCVFVCQNNSKNLYPLLILSLSISSHFMLFYFLFVQCWLYFIIYSLGCVLDVRCVFFSSFISEFVLSIDEIGSVDTVVHSMLFLWRL